MDLPFFFLLMCGYVICLTVWGVVNGRRIFELPIVVAMFAIAWLIPQGLTAERQTFGVTVQDEFFWAYVLACLAALTWGFYAGKRAGLRRAGTSRGTEWPYSYNRLTLCAASLVAVGALALLLMSRTAAEQGLGSEWTGVATAYALLANTRTFGVCLAALLFARTGRILPLVIAIIGIIVALPMIDSGVKRSVIFETLVTTGGAYYLARHSFPPRTVVIVLAVFGTVLLHEVGAVREYTKSTNSTFVEAILSGVMLEEFAYFNLDKAFEITQAKDDVRYINETMNIEFGVEYWNQLTHQYVPAFILGRHFKESLKFETLRSRARSGKAPVFSSRGATRTGFSDTFRSFWLFGALFFSLIGYVGGRLYALARSGGLSSQSIYLILMSECLVAITHGTAIFLATLPFAVGTMVAVFWFSKIRKPRIRTRGNRQKHVSHR